jgi:hypothetical protein
VVVCDVVLLLVVADPVVVRLVAVVEILPPDVIETPAVVVEFSLEVTDCVGRGGNVTFSLQYFALNNQN